MLSVNIVSDFLRQKTRTCSFQSGRILKEEELVSLCNKFRADPPGVMLLKETESGSYLISTDIIRSIPVFYCQKEDKLFVSDTTEDLLKYSSGSISGIYSKEFLHTGYTSGKNTLLEDVTQLQAGEYLYVNDKGIVAGFYHKYLAHNIIDLPYERMKDKLTGVLEEIFRTLVENLGGRPVYVPLSGGYDSRLILYWLKRLNYNRVECFTYGRAGNTEVANARKTAEGLGFKWRFIDYSTIKLTDYLGSEDFDKYYHYMSNHSSMFYMQEYFALQDLKASGLLSAETVFIPGHSADSLAGSHLFPGLKHQASTDSLSKMIYRKHYHLIPDKYDPALLDEISKGLDKGGYESYQLYEDWVMRERQAKFVVNSARIFSFFGYDYLLPYYDIRLTDFFTSVPMKYKLHKKLYNEVVFSLFSDYGLNFPVETCPSQYQLRLNRVKQDLLWCFPFLRKFSRLRTDDPHCYREVTGVMVDELRAYGEEVCRSGSYNGYIVQ